MGTASGALSNDKNVYEKDINLAIANKIAALAPSYNINIVLTRNNDNTITAQDRIAFMNSVPYDLLVSIHVNASNISREPKPDYPNKSGFEVYVSRNNTSSSDKSELLARHIIKTNSSHYIQPITRQRSVSMSLFTYSIKVRNLLHWLNVVILTTIKISPISPTQQIRRISRKRFLRELLPTAILVKQASL